MDGDVGLREIDLITTSSIELKCQVRYSNCTSEVWWLGKGACPQCSEAPPNGAMICNSCRIAIVGGASMHHRNCGFHGTARDFYTAIQPI